VAFNALASIKNPDAKKKFVMGIKVGGFSYNLKDRKEPKMNTEFTGSDVITVSGV
jgi:hypothetical protein